MSDELHVRVQLDSPPIGETGEWVRADIMLNGEVAATGWCPVRGDYKVEGIADKSAVSLAIGKFSRDIGKDVRYYASEAAD